MALDGRLAALITALGTDIKALVGGTMSNTSGGKEKVGTPSATSGNIVLNLNDGNVFPLTPTAAVTSLAFNNVPNGVGVSVRLCVTQGATVYNIPLPTGGIYYGVTPTGVASKKTIFDYFTIDGGTSWHCSGVNQV